MPEVSFSEAIRAFGPVSRGGIGADPGPLAEVAVRVAITGTGTLHMPDCKSLGKARARSYAFAELIAAGVKRGCRACRIDDRMLLTDEQSAYALAATVEWRPAAAAREEAERRRREKTDLKNRIKRADDQLTALTSQWSRQRLPEGSWPPTATATTATGICHEILRDTTPISLCEADAVVAYDAEMGTLTYRCPDDSKHHASLHEQAKILVAHGHPYRAARDFDLWLTWQTDRSAALAALEALENQYMNVPPLRPIPTCATCGERIQIHPSVDDEIWYCPGEQGTVRHLFRRENRSNFSSVYRAVERAVRQHLEVVRRPAFGYILPFGPERTNRLGDECLLPAPELLDKHHERLLATIAVIDNAGLAAADEDFDARRRQCQETLEAVQTLQTDGSARRVLEAAIIDGGAPSEIQQWLLIDAITVGAEGPPDVRFILDQPDVRERLELAELRAAITAAREWADTQEAELRARENRQSAKASCR